MGQRKTGLDLGHQFGSFVRLAGQCVLVVDCAEAYGEG